MRRLVDHSICHKQVSVFSAIALANSRCYQIKMNSFFSGEELDKQKLDLFNQDFFFRKTTNRTKSLNHFTRRHI